MFQDPDSTRFFPGKQCSVLPEVAYGQYSVPQCSDPAGSRPFSTKCHVTCHSGYQLKGATQVEYVCLKSGRWNMEYAPAACVGMYQLS